VSISHHMKRLAEHLAERAEQPLCPTCGRTRRRDCDGRGWLDAIGPCADGSYVTSRPCPND